MPGIYDETLTYTNRPKISEYNNNNNNNNNNAFIIKMRSHSVTNGWIRRNL